MLGAMQGVSKEVYEAARVDGAGPIMRFFAITIPMISPAIFFSLIINITNAFGGRGPAGSRPAFQPEFGAHGIVHQLSDVHPY